jgi:hypothetical protein
MDTLGVVNATLNNDAGVICFVTTWFTHGYFMINDAEQNGQF